MAFKEDIKNDLVELESGTLVTRFAYLHNIMISINKQYNIINEYLKKINCYDEKINNIIIRQLYNCKKLLEKPHVMSYISDIVINMYIIEDELNNIIINLQMKFMYNIIELINHKEKIDTFIKYFQNIFNKINQIKDSYNTMPIQYSRDTTIRRTISNDAAQALIQLYEVVDFAKKN